jgi:hypothetical protein
MSVSVSPSTHDYPFQCESYHRTFLSFPSPEQFYCHCDSTRRTQLGSGTILPLDWHVFCHRTFTRRSQRAPGTTIPLDQYFYRRGNPTCQSHEWVRKFNRSTIAQPRKALALSYTKHIYRHITSINRHRTIPVRRRSATDAFIFESWNH